MLLARKVAAKAGLVAGAIAFVTVAAFFLSDTYLDGFLKRRIARALEDEYPACLIEISRLHYNLLENRLQCDSVRLMKVDSTISCNVARLSVSGIGRIQLLWGGGIGPENLANATAGAENIVLAFPLSHYELRCERLRVSVPDSEVVLEALEYHPVAADEQFFAGSKSRRTLYRLFISECSLMGSACLGMLEGKLHCARTAQVQHVFLDVLINKDKPAESEPASAPNAILSSIREALEIDSVIITNGRLRYCERFAPGSAPAVITIDNMNVSAAWVADRAGRGDTAIFRAEGTLMKNGRMNVRVSIPIESPAFSFQYSGHLSEMSLCEFNPFIEISEHRRVKTGILHSGAFDIDVWAGSARGTATATYKDLKIVSISDDTRSESGLGNFIASFIANNIKLRTTNMPDESGSTKIGQVRYQRKRDEAFLAFGWIALRGGLADIVGF